MINLKLKNLKEVPTDIERDAIETEVNELLEYLRERFKKYSKDMTLEVILNKSSKTTSVSISLDMKSKKVLLAEEDKHPVYALKRLIPKFKKAVTKQYQLERKDYEYKRKRK